MISFSLCPTTLLPPLPLCFRTAGPDRALTHLPVAFCVEQVSGRELAGLPPVSLLLKGRPWQRGTLVLRSVQLDRRADVKEQRPCDRLDDRPLFSHSKAFF